MKKILTTTALVLTTLTTTFAQQKKGDVELGFHAGYSYANVSSGSLVNADNKSGLNAGIAADFYFSNRWSLKTKLIFDQKGWGDGFFSNDNNNNFKTDYRLNYITLPIMANWHFGKKRNWYLNFGPYVGYLAGAKASDISVDVKDYFHNTDFGIAAGIGTKIRLSDNIKLLLEYDEQAGLTDIFKTNPGSAVRNGRGSLNVGFNFILK
ncbi:porin family protein [Mucilaginibacter sp. SG564]|uniref:porin family protein n=1 Tax=Mucilaginibacter sp. SG564 TaxID=2587022 RepID=UPI001552632C|nr:porin family protein [Mucilaginibacter sp. SG564]NOW95172.1 opacity protein-like surface antigen [Mucilaginibacter sp. SG564]